MSNPYDTFKLDKQLSKVPSVSEASEPELKHRVSVTVSDPQHTMASKRGDKVEKRIRVLAKDESSAVELARHHYKKQGYKVHDANHIGIVEAVGLDDKEEVEQVTESFKDLKSAISHASAKVKTHRDPDDGIEVYKLKSGGYDVNHTMNSSGRNALIKSGAKHLGTVSRDAKMNVTHNIKEESENRFSKYIIKPVKTEPKIVRKSTPSGRTTDHVEYEVHGKVSSQKRSFKSKKEAEDYLSTVKEEASYNSDDWYLFHKKTHKPAGSVGAKSIVGKNLGSQYKDKPDYDENHYAVRGMSVKSHLASLKKNEEDSSREKIFKNSKDKMKELFKNAHPQGNKRPDV